MNKVTATHSIIINKTPDKVWDYTQDWNRRSEWDRSVKSAEYLSMNHPAPVKVLGTGGFNFQVTYKMSERPRMTTLAMSELNSFWIKGGGGSWKYEELDGKTVWTQHNTLVLRDDFLGRICRPAFSFALATMTKQIMNRAKSKIERNQQ